MQARIVTFYLRNYLIVQMFLQNLKRNISTNAAGVVICSQSLETLIPMCTLNDEMFTGVTKDYLENMGFLKIYVIV